MGSYFWRDEVGSEQTPFLRYPPRVYTRLAKWKVARRSADLYEMPSCRASPSGSSGSGRRSLHRRRLALPSRVGRSARRGMSPASSSSSRAQPATTLLGR